MIEIFLRGLSAALDCVAMEERENDEGPGIELVLVEPFNPDWSFSQIAQHHTPLGWEEFFESAKAELEMIDEALEGKRTVPQKSELFTAFHRTPLDDVRVVLLGQDPYPAMINGPDGLIPRATGMSFSVRPGDTAASLLNIFKELQREYPDYRFPAHGDLSSWANQGVLLLNTGLTTEPGSKCSHIKIWAGFFEKVIRYLSRKKPSTIFLLWGREAQKISRLIPDSCIQLKAGHPSPLNRNGDFLGCNHFRKVNEFLVKQGQNPIDWQI